MKTIIVDDELWAVKQLETAFSGRPGIELAGTFRDGESALEYAKVNPVGAFFIQYQQYLNKSRLLVINELVKG